MGREASWQANPSDITAAKALQRFLTVFFWGLLIPGIATIVLCFLCIELTASQWSTMIWLVPPGVALYAIPELIISYRSFKPVSVALAEQASREQIAAGLVRCLNLPSYAFLRVLLVRGILAGIAAGSSLMLGNAWFGLGFQSWQIAMFPALVLFFACPAYALVEYFLVSRHIEPLVETLWRRNPRLSQEYRNKIIAVSLRTKLLYLCAFIGALPLIFITISMLFKVGLLLESHEITNLADAMAPLVRWMVGAMFVCILGAFAVSTMTASEVTNAASRLIRGMNEVESGNLDVDLKILGTDEYADLTRGFNLMTDGLRAEVQVLEIAQEVAGELKLDVLIDRIMSAANQLLDAERSTLFLHDPNTKELWSQFGHGLEAQEIRIPDNTGIAGAVLYSGIGENIVNAYADPRFNTDVDVRTGFKTRSILCLPITNKNDKVIGVTQVLNKRGGSFTSKDENRLRAFTAQVTVALENAQLFDQVLEIKNYNENILASTTNAVITLDSNDRFVTANDAAMALLNLSKEQLLKTAASDFFADSPWVLRCLERVQENRSGDSVFDAELHREDGSTASVNLNANELINAAGEVIGSILSFEDFSQEKRVKTTMARYMNQEVADQLLSAGDAALGGKLQKVSILFSDIRDFTTVSEALGPRETVSMLNEYFEEMVEVIFQHQGILDKYIGDAMMALFGSPFTGEQDADNAVQVANDMMRALRVLNDRRAANQQPALNMGIGVSTGDVVVGSIGSPRRMEYTAIGDSVNLSARLEGLTKHYGVKVLLSAQTVDDLKTPTRVREIDLLRVKGQAQSVSVYEALDHHTEESFLNMDACINHYSQGLEHYRARDWAAAKQAFGAALNSNPNDGPSKIHLARCEHYCSEPPAENWDGVWTMTHK